MARNLKTFRVRPAPKPSDAAPKSSQLTVDLGGLDLSENQLAQIRNNAVRAALTAAAGLIDPGRFADGFSTFSTFSTFGSGSAGFGGLNRSAEAVIDEVAGA
jgi:hypothetical protein